MRDTTARFECGARVLAMLLVAAPLANPAQAQNLLPKPSFDSPADLPAGWTNLDASKYWTLFDVDSNPASGSLRIDNSSANAGSGVGVFSACVEVVPGQPYDFSVWQYTPSPQAADGFVQLMLQWRQSCPSGAFTGGDVTTSSSALGAWTLVSSQGQAPLDATGARLWMSASKAPAGGTHSVYFDEAFVPEPAAEAGALAAAVTLLAAVRQRRCRAARSAGGSPRAGEVGSIC